MILELKLCHNDDEICMFSVERVAKWSITIFGSRFRIDVERFFILMVIILQYQRAIVDAYDVKVCAVSANCTIAIAMVMQLHQLSISKLIRMLWIVEKSLRCHISSSFARTIFIQYFIL
jgi:hypothetical protein